MGTTLLVREPIGVCGMITPWNWPLNQIACKVAPALAAGCTMVLKPSEVAPLNAIIFAEILDEAGVPAGVFNLVNGDGVNVGAPLSAHPDVDMVSFTGSTRAGIEVARNAAPDGEAGRAGARRQVGQHHPRRRRLRRASSPATWPAMCNELGPVVQRADPHARARRRGWTRPRPSRPRPPRTSSSATRARRQPDRSGRVRRRSTAASSSSSRRASARAPSSRSAAPAGPKGSRPATTCSRPCSPT